MQVTKIYNFNNSYNNSVNFKCNKEAVVPAKIMNMLKGNIKETFLFTELNSVNKYVVPYVQKRVGLYPKNSSLNMVKVPSKQLSALLGEESKNYKLSLLEGICVVVADKSGELGNCNQIYETTVCLVPDPTPNPSLYEMLFK